MKVLQFPPAYPPGQSPYDVFKNRMSAILSIVGGIKGIIENKFINNQLKTIAGNILNKVGKQKATDLSNLIMSPPPKEIYPNNLEDIVGQFVDKFAMGPMMRKETMMGKLPYPTPGAGPIMQKEITTGGLPALGGIAPTAMPTVTPTTETMIPKMDIYQIYNAVKDLPSGEISWDSIYKKMTEKKPFWMGTTESEQYVLNQMLGQVTDPKAKMVSDINLAKLVQETFYPGEEKITSEIDFFRKDPTGFIEYKQLLESLDITTKEKELATYTGMYNRKEITRDEFMKLIGGYVTPEKLTDFQKKYNMLIDICEKNNISITADNIFKLFGAYVGEEVKVPTYSVAEKIEEGFMEKVEDINDFTNELNRLKGLNINTSTFETTEYFTGLMKKKYEEMMSYIKHAFDKITAGAGEEIHEKSGKSYRELYREYWEKARNYDEQYFMVTGEHLLRGE